MQKFQQVLLSVWREACRHIEIERSTQTITSMLLDDMPLGQLIVRRIDPQRSRVESVAVGLPESEYAALDAAAECTASEMDRLNTWTSKGKVCRCPSSRSLPAELKTAISLPDECDLLIGPLQETDESLGLIVLVASPGQTFTERHKMLAEVLLAPFAAALANDQRLRQIASLRQAAEAENRSLLQRLGRKKLSDTIVGERSGLLEVMKRVELVAKSDAPVLIFGETGTGKELIARAIHSRSPRAQGPVLRVNCGAIPPELIDSELFGHERGAFTGAVESRKGWFERADGGTLFLDEIGELPPPAQVRLLRILQDGWLERVGGEKSVHVDVRIVAATHRDLADMVAQGSFRADLWYRIAVFPLVLPPLRERREDIAEMAAHFARRAATRFTLPEILPTADDLRLLENYSWPGNVRELGAVIDRAAILGNGQQLEVRKALGIESGPTERAKSSSRQSHGKPAAIEPLDVVIRKHIESALAATEGRVEGRGGTADLLAINPNTLRARMRKLGIDWQQFRS